MEEREELNLEEMLELAEKVKDWREEVKYNPKNGVTTLMYTGALLLAGQLLYFKLTTRALEEHSPPVLLKAFTESDGQLGYCSDRYVGEKGRLAGLRQKVMDSVKERRKKEVSEGLHIARDFLKYKAQ
jgi:hypothetical protein